MNNTIVEYINGMEVVKVFNRDGESYKRFEQDVRGYRDFTLAWYKVCWPWMALYNSILPCLALFTLPIGAYLVLSSASTLPDLALVLCMSFGAGAPLLRALSLRAVGKPAAFPSGRECLFSIGGVAVFHISIVQNRRMASMVYCFFMRDKIY